MGVLSTVIVVVVIAAIIWSQVGPMAERRYPRDRRERETGD
jgi:hypothetical protein